MAKQSKTQQDGKHLLHGCDSIDVAIAELLDKRPDLTDGEIAVELHMSRTAIQHRRNLPRWEAMYADRHPPAKDFYKHVKPIARKRLLELLRSKQHAVALKVCERLLGVDLAPTHEEDSASKRAADLSASAIVRLVEKAEERIRGRAKPRKPAVGG